MAKALEDTINVNEVSRISSGTTIKGEISSPNDIRIDGTFEGRAYSKARVLIGEKAVIKGDVVCDNMDLWGKMTGSICTRDVLTLKKGSVFSGDLRIKRFVVELGAHFDGTCRMLAEGEYDKIVEQRDVARADTEANMEMVQTQLSSQHVAFGNQMKS